MAGRIVDFQPDSWTTHVSGHPPGALLVFVALDRLGLGGGGWAGLACVLVQGVASDRPYAYWVWADLAAAAVCAGPAAVVVLRRATMLRPGPAGALVGGSPGVLAWLRRIGGRPMCWRGCAGSVAGRLRCCYR